MSEEHKHLEFKTLASFEGELNDDGEIVGVASTKSIDREGDIIEAAAWKNHEEGADVTLPLLWSHDANEIGLGKILWTKGSDDGLALKAKFQNVTQKARDIYELVKQGFIKHLSVGFRALDWELLDKENPMGGRRFKNVELLEVSIVNVPALTDAQITAVKSFVKSDDILDAIEPIKEPEGNLIVKEVTKEEQEAIIASAEERLIKETSLDFIKKRLDEIEKSLSEIQNRSEPVSDALKEGGEIDKQKSRDEKFAEAISALIEGKNNLGNTNE